MDADDLVTYDSLRGTIRVRLISVAGFLYAVSMHKFAFRDPLSADTGIQAVIEVLGITGALACTFLAIWRLKFKISCHACYFCFALFGFLALASCFRSYNPALSFVKGSLLLIVIAASYLTDQGGLGQQFMRAIYWSYISLLAMGIVTGLVFPNTYPLLSVDAFSGRTRMSVFDTFPGTMGENAGMLLLLAPLIQPKIGWISQTFLLLMNLLAGGKTSTALLCFMLSIRFVIQRRPWRSRRAVVAFVTITAIMGAGAVSQFAFAPVANYLTRSAESVYGTGVTQDAVSLDGRLDLWRASLKLLVDAPLLGYGFDGAREVMLRVASWSGSSHNGYLELALSSGLPGLMVFFVGLYSIALTCFRAPPFVRLPALCLLIFLLGTALVSLTFNFPSYFGIAILIWLSAVKVNSVSPIHSAPAAIMKAKPRLRWMPPLIEESQER